MVGCVAAGRLVIEVAINLNNRRLIMKRILLLAMLVLAGCAHYDKPGATPQLLVSDRAQCDYEAEKATATNQSVMEYENIHAMCMQLKGYTLEKN
jgi:hypothetical protein